MSLLWASALKHFCMFHNKNWDSSCLKALIDGFCLQSWFFFPSIYSGCIIKDKNKSQVWMFRIWMDKVATSGSLPSGVAVAMALKAALHLYLLQWGCARPVLGCDWVTSGRERASDAAPAEAGSSLFSSTPSTKFKPPSSFFVFQSTQMRRLLPCLISFYSFI